MKTNTKNQAKQKLHSPFLTSWYVLFTPLHNDICRQWWHRLINKKYAHVRAFTDMGNYWLYVDPLSSHLDIRIVEKEFDLIEASKKEGILVLVTTLVLPKTVSGVLPSTCVSVVKLLLGISSWDITPYSLFKTLIGKYNGRIC